MAGIETSYQNLLPDLQNHEAYRLRRIRVINNNKRFLKFYSFLSLLALIYVLTTNTLSEDDFSMAITFIIVFQVVELVVAAIIYGVNRGKYEEYFKKNIIEKLVPAIIPGIIYNHDGHISMNSFNECKLFSRRKGNKIFGTDYFHGRSDEMEFELSLLNIKHKRKRRVGESANDYRRERGTDIFNGLFMIANLRNPVSKVIDVVPSFKELGKLVKAMASGLNVIGKSDAPEVFFGNDEFQEKFNVYSDDKNEAMRVVTQPVIDMAVNLKTKQNAFQVYASYVGNKVYVAIDGAKHLFEVKISDSLLDPKSTENIFKDLLTYMKVLKTYAGY